MEHQQKAIVLGASGLLGYHCVEKLRSLDYETFGTYSSIRVDDEKFFYIDAVRDLSNLSSFLKKNKPQLLINTIAFATVDGCEFNPALAEKLNIDYLKKLVELIKDIPDYDPHLIHISTDSVYGDKPTNEQTPWKEQDPKSPISVYAKTKLRGEALLTEIYGQKLTILRAAFYGINPHSTKSLLFWIINNARKGNKMDGWENIFFSPISAWFFAEAIEKCYQKKAYGIFNVSSTDTCNKYDFVHTVCSELGLNTVINRVTVTDEPVALIRPNYSVLDSSKLSNVIKMETDWKSDLLAYLKNMPEFPNV